MPHADTTRRACLRRLLGASGWAGTAGLSSLAGTSRILGAVLAPGAAGTAGVAGLTVVATTSAHAAPATTLDLLDRPAPATTRGPTRLLLDVATGGPGLIAVGEMGLILASADGGASWVQQPSPTSVMLTAVAFADARRGWAVGHDGVVLATTDGGATWRRQFDGRQANEAVLKSAREALASAQAAQAGRSPSRRSALSGAGGAGRTTGAGNGGAVPSSAQAADNDGDAPSPLSLAEDSLASAEDAIKAGPSRPLLALHVFDAQRVLVAGAFGQLFSTEDGGERWQYLGGDLPNPEGLHLYGIDVDSAGGIKVAAEQGAVFLGEATTRWRRSETGYAGNLHGVLVIPGQTAAPDTWLAYGFNGHLFRSTDRGARWSAVSSSPSSKTWVRASMAQGAAWLLAEDGRLLVTKDAGQSFHAAPPGELPVRRYAGFTVDTAGGHLVAVGQGGVQRLSLQRAHVGLNLNVGARRHSAA